MSPLRERILCDLLFGVECFSCPFDNAQRNAKTNKYTEWLPRLHVFILSGVHEAQYPEGVQGRQGQARQVRRRVELTKATHSNFAMECLASRFGFSQLTRFTRALYFSRIPEPLFFLPCKPQLTLPPRIRWGCECYRAVTSVTGPGKTESCRHDQAIIRIKYSPGIGTFGLAPMHAPKSRICHESV